MHYKQWLKILYMFGNEKRTFVTFVPTYYTRKDIDNMCNECIPYWINWYGAKSEVDAITYEFKR